MGTSHNGLNRLLTLDDFEAEQCVTHYYEKDGRWYWYCMTDDTGSGKRKQHLKGHTKPGDAAVAAKYHRNAKHRARKQKAYRAWWWNAIMTTTDLDFFVALWENHWGARIWDEDPSDIMARVQSDNDLWEYVKRLNSDGLHGQRQANAKAAQSFK